MDLSKVVAETKKGLAEFLQKLSLAGIVRQPAGEEKDTCSPSTCWSRMVRQNFVRWAEQNFTGLLIEA
jgi:hypothetical protein